MLRILVTAGLVCLAGAAARIADAQALPTNTTRTLLIRVQTGSEPLGYSIVALPALDIERFTGASGAIVIARPKAGTHRIVVKRLGFTPKDTTITVTEAAPQVIIIQLARVTFQLQEVRVVDWPACVRPGLREADAEVRAIVDQLRQNAERYRLLTRTYPFSYIMQTESGTRGSDGSYLPERDGLTSVSAMPSWRYRPGTLVAREGASWVMRIPTIGDLAEDAFIDNHCFRVAGLELKEDVRLLRIDIAAAERLKGVDVNAVVWLDPTDFRLRHATFTLTRPPPQVRDLLHSTTAVRYRELIPFVPIIASLVTDNTTQLGASRSETLVLVERQTNTRVMYSFARPDSLLPDSLPRRVPDR